MRHSRNNTSAVAGKTRECVRESGLLRVFVPFSERPEGHPHDRNSWLRHVGSWGDRGGPGNPARAPHDRHVRASGHARAGGPVRSRGHRLAGLPYRQVQSALHLLHARRGAALVETRGIARHRRDEPAHPHRRRGARHHHGALHRRRTAAAPGPGGHHRGDRGAAFPSENLVDYQRDQPRQLRRAAGAGRTEPGQRLAGHPRPRGVQAAHPPRPA